MGTVCVKAEQKNAKISNWTWLEGLLWNTRTFWKKVSLLLVVLLWHAYCLTTIFDSMQEYSTRLLVLQRFSHSKFVYEQSSPSAQPLMILA